jgi:hypothetical protein
MLKMDRLQIQKVALRQRALFIDDAFPGNDFGNLVLIPRRNIDSPAIVLEFKYPPYPIFISARYPTLVW